MSMAAYTVYLSDARGVRLTDASNFVKLQYTRVVNDVGSLKLWLPAAFDARQIRLPDGRVEVWRQLPGTSRSALDTETTWLIKAVQWDRDNSGKIALLIEADTPNVILREHVYDYPIGEGLPADSGGAASTIQNIFDLNLATASDTTFSDRASRNLSAFITPDGGVAASALHTGLDNTFSVSGQSLLKAMQTVVQLAWADGEYLAFDIIAPTADTLAFMVYLGQRGVDHRAPNGNPPVIFGGEWGNVGQATLRTDYRKELTWARVMGQGQGASQFTGTGRDNTRIAAAPFGRRETWVTNSQMQSDAACAAAAAAIVRGARMKRSYRGRLLDTEAARYGRDWGWGDFVTVQDFGQSFDVRITSVTVTVEQGKENIDAWGVSD